jgi:hypothetical protein
MIRKTPGSFRRLPATVPSLTEKAHPSTDSSNMPPMDVREDMEDASLAGRRSAAQSAAEICILTQN